MASAFGHITAALSGGYVFFPERVRWSNGVAAAFCSIVPDLDVIPLFFGVPYRSIYGHRGWSHSILFALIFGACMGYWLSQKTPTMRRQLMGWMILATLSHPFLDMLTAGGLGVALFFPFNNQRFFFPLQPILASPLGAGGFQAKWGLSVLLSEFYWIDLPCLCLIACSYTVRRLRKLFL
jgi:inner membrane protein